MTVPVATQDERFSAGGGASSEGGLDRRVIAAQYFAEVSQYIFDNPQFFVRQADGVGGVGEDAEPPLQLLWARLAESRLFMWSFMLLFVLPVMIGVVYYVGFASVRYATDIQMSLRSRNGSSSLNGSLLGLASGNATYFANPDVYVLAHYLRSREAVEMVNRTIDLRRVWGRADVDPLSRLSPDAQIEDVVDVWRRYVSVGVDPLSTSVLIEIQAFDPDDAGRIGDALASGAESVVNMLTERARNDAVRFAETRVVAAEAAVTAAREQVRLFRDRIESVAPNKTAEITLTAATELMQKKLKIERDLTMRRRELADDSPIVRRLQTDLETVDAQIAEINRKTIAAPTLAMAGSERGRPAPSTASTAFSGQFLEYDEQLTRQMIGEKLHMLMLDLLESARQTAQRQQMYVTPFVRPTLAKDPRYPRRIRSIAGVAGLAFLVWMSVMLLVTVIREDLAYDD